MKLQADSSSAHRERPRLNSSRASITLNLISIRVCWNIWSSKRSKLLCTGRWRCQEANSTPIRFGAQDSRGPLSNSATFDAINSVGWLA